MSGSGTKDDPWALKTPPGSGDDTMWRDDTADPAQLVWQVGSTTLLHDARVIDDLHTWLREQGDWVAGLAEVEHNPRSNRMRAR